MEWKSKPLAEEDKIKVLQKNIVTILLSMQ